MCEIVIESLNKTSKPQLMCLAQNTVNGIKQSNDVYMVKMPGETTFKDVSKEEFERLQKENKKPKWLY